MTKDGWIEKPDEVQLFTLYTLFGGDTARVSVVTRVPKEQIDSLAHDFNWKAKAAGRGRLDTEEGAENEKVMNRVASYSTALRLDNVFTRLVNDLDGDPTFARAFCTSFDEEGRAVFSVKNVVDLAKGLQILNDIKYRALQDKQAQTADTSSGIKGVAEISLTVYKGLANRFDRNASVDTAKEVIKAVEDAVANKTKEES